MEYFRFWFTFARNSKCLFCIYILLDLNKRLKNFTDLLLPPYELKTRSLKSPFSNYLTVFSKMEATTIKFYRRAFMQIERVIKSLAM